MSSDSHLTASGLFICRTCAQPGLLHPDGARVPGRCHHILHWECVFAWYERDFADPQDMWPCGCVMTPSETDKQGSGKYRWRVGEWKQRLQRKRRETY